MKEIHNEQERLEKKVRKMEESGGEVKREQERQGEV